MAKTNVVPNRYSRFLDRLRAAFSPRRLGFAIMAVSLVGLGWVAHYAETYRTRVQIAQEQIAIERMYAAAREDIGDEHAKREVVRAQAMYLAHANCSDAALKNRILALEEASLAALALRAASSVPTVLPVDRPVLKAPDTFDHTLPTLPDHPVDDTGETAALPTRDEAGSVWDEPSIDGVPDAAELTPPSVEFADETDVLRN